MKKKKNNKLKDIILYCISILLLFASLVSLFSEKPSFSFSDLFLMLFSISLMPFIYKKILKNVKFKNLNIIIPVICFILLSCAVSIESPDVENNNNFNDQQSETEGKISIEFEIEKLDLEIGTTQKINYKLSPLNTIVKTLEWTSSNKKIASVDESGNVTGNKVGSTVISLKVNDEIKKIDVNVFEPKYQIEESIKNISEVYYNNEATGNSKFFGKKIKTSGIFDDISIDESVLFNTGVTLHLTENGSRYSLLCNNHDGIKGVTNYIKGDTIIVVGKMNTMVGNSLLLDDCEIYDENINEHDENIKK